MSSTPRSSGFDRVRPRTPRSEPADSVVGHDAQGKRALFSSASGGEDLPGVGSVLVECSRCDCRTVLGPAQAWRAAWPSLHLALRIGHRDDVTVLGLSGRDHPSYLRCPACRRLSWVRFTVQV